MTIIIIIGAALFIFILFNNDRNDERSKTNNRGGVKNIYKNFIRYVELTNSGDIQHYLLINEPNYQYVKDDGEYLEYKYPIISYENNIDGYYYIGIHHTFGTFAYCFCINSKGKKIEGYMRELHNGRDSSKPRDRNIEEYKDIFSNLILSMESKPKFEDKFFGNL